MIRAAVEAVEAHSTKVVAVSVLTSLSDSELSAVFPNESRKSVTLRLAELAASSGAHGLVLSVPSLIELGSSLESFWDKPPVFVTPGIRDSDSPRGDQTSTGTLEEAVRSKSSLLVIGRPILSGGADLALTRFEDYAQRMLKLGA